MGDAPIAYVEGAGGTRVSEDQIVTVGKNDVREIASTAGPSLTEIQILSFKVGR